MTCESTSGYPTDVIQPFPMSLRFDHLCTLNNESVQQRYPHRNLYRPLRPNGIGLHIIRNPSPLVRPLIEK
jgi:hypothetical protein